MAYNLTIIMDTIFDWIKDNVEPSWFSTQVENHIIWADQSGTQPKSPFITLKIISGPTEVGSTDDLIYDEENETVKIDGLRSITVSIQAFGGKSNEILAQLQASLQFPNVNDYFRSKGLSAYDNSSISDISTPLDTIFEKRSTMDVLFYVPFEFETTIETIEEVEVSQES